MLRGVADDAIVERLRQERVSAKLARETLTALRQDPVFIGAARIARHSRQIEMLAALQRTLRASVEKVERRKKPPAKEFFERYLATGTPVVFTDAMRGWKALRRWNPSYFKRRIGEVELLVTMGRDGDPDYDMHTAERSKKLTMAELAERVQKTKKSNDFYLVANNHAMDHPEMQVLLEDVVFDPKYFHHENTRGAVSLWFGPRGTVTPMHHDTTNIVLHQVYGRKRLQLLSPFETDALPHLRSVYCDIDPEKPDPEHRPVLDRMRLLEVELKKGDALFIPVGWFHHVRALEASINISFTNLRVPNDYEWYRPGNVS